MSERIMAFEARSEMLKLFKNMPKSSTFKEVSRLQSVSLSDLLIRALNVRTLWFICGSANCFTVMRPSLSGSGGNIRNRFRPKWSLFEATNGIFIVFVRALILLIEGLFVCLFISTWAVAGNTRLGGKVLHSLLLWT